MIAVIDYGVGNLFSLCRSLEAIGRSGGHGRPRLYCKSR